VASFRVVVTAELSAAARWRTALEAWALPDEILAQASESPWIHPPVIFQVPAVIEDSPSHGRAREVLSPGGSVLDVGCGGGIAAFALTPPATSVVGVDQQVEMLTMFRDNATARAVACTTVEGSWPDVASRVDVADVVVAHHVVYNVADIVPFLWALHEHARTRVVLEMPDHHPLSNLSSAWAHFWGLARPTNPTPEDLMDVLVEMGLAPQRERWRGAMRQERDLAQAAHFTRVRLCLAPEREGEVYDFLAAQAPARERELSTIWWDREA
jgi:SAM-dependent methyltransferase